MKILFYIDALGGGGAERVIANLANGMSLKGQDIVLVTSFPLVSEYKILPGIKRYNLEKSCPVKRELVRKNIRRIKRLRTICKNEACNIAVSFMEGPSFRLIFSTLWLKTNTVISLRSDPTKCYSNVIHKWIAELIYARAKACVFQTEEAKNFFSQKIQMRSTIIFNPVADEFYKTEYKNEKKYIVSAGRLIKSKNFEMLISAFAAIAGQYPKEKLIIYGEGDNRSRLERLIAKSGLSDRIRLSGRTDDMAQKLQDAKIFVLPSLYEGMPNVLMEAMALGIPSIATDCPCGGPKLLLGNGNAGILVQNGNEQQMADAISALIEDQELRQRYSEKAVQRAKDFKCNKICEEWLELFLNILGKVD